MPNGAAALAGSYPVSMVPSSMGGYSAVPSSGALGGLLGGSLSGSLGGSGRHGGGGDYDPRPSPGGGGRGGGAGAGGGSGGNKSGAAIASLPRVLRDRVDDLLRGPAGQVLRPGHFDDRVCDSLSRLPEADALAVLREVGDSSDLSRMQNVAAYIMSIIKRHRHDRPGRH